MKLSFLFLLFIYFFACPAQASQFALVIGGATKNMESTQQEFARTTLASAIGLNMKGYNVTTLFGSAKNSEEQQKYAGDYKKFETVPGTKDNATNSAIDKAFEDLIAKAHSGDSVEILVAAHGNDTCGELGGLIKNDLSSGCKHTFTVFDKDGYEAQYASDKILQYVKRLEEKGAQTNIVFSSCHSGRAKDEFKKLNLKNSCAFFQTAGNELGYGCFEDDPDFSKDFTSSSEYFALMYYKDALPQLKKDPYFSKSKCFQKTTQYFKNQKMDLTSMSSTFWSARKSDQTFQSPALSSLLNFNYFSKGTLQPQINKAQALSCEQLKMANTTLTKQLLNLGAQISDAVTNSYDQSLVEYNQAVLELQSSIEKPESALQISNKQAKVDDLAATVVHQERILIDQLFKQNQSPPNDPCARPLK